MTNQVVILDPRLAYTYDEAAAQVGVSESFIKNAVRDGDLTAHYLNGTSPRVHRSDLDAWVLAAPTERRTA